MSDKLLILRGTAGDEALELLGMLKILSAVWMLSAKKLRQFAGDKIFTYCIPGSFCIHFTPT